MVEDIKKIVESKEEKLIKISDKIWDYGETRFEEVKSAELLIKSLKEEGFTVKEKVADIDTAFVGEFVNGEINENTPIIGFLGEYDALSGLSQISGEAIEKPICEGAPGHGCGHNLLGAGAFGAAITVKEYLIKNNINGVIRYFGCPAEEGGSGKTYMAREGVFDGTDFSLTWHPGDKNKVYGESSLANIQAYFRFTGISSHAAGSPESGRSALDSIEIMNIGANYLREHVSKDVCFHYAVTDTGGNAPNVVQAQGEVLYLIRAPEINEAQKVYERICNIARGSALINDTQVEIVFDKACSNYLPNIRLSKLMYENMKKFGAPDFDEEDKKLAREIRKTLGKDILDIYETDITPYEELNKLLEKHRKDELSTVIYPYYPEMANTHGAGSTDVGDASWVMPVAQIYMATAPKATMAHTWQWVAVGKSPMAHKGMLRATQIMAGTAIDAINNPQIIKEAKEEHSRKMEKTPYVNPIPKDIKPNMNN